MENLSNQSKSFLFLSKLGYPVEKIRLWTKIFHPESITDRSSVAPATISVGTLTRSAKKKCPANTGSTNTEALSLVWITTDHQAFGYGCNASGCLGINRTTVSRVRTPTPIPVLKSPMIKLVSGCRFAVALSEQGSCYSWGDNKFGQLGLGRSNMTVAQPTLISGDMIHNRPVIDVVCGLYHTLLLNDQMDVFAFGSNVVGAVGNGTTIHQNRPFRLASLMETHPTIIGSDLIRIAAGGWHSAAVNLKGNLLAWGFNQDGQCGHNDLKWNPLVPVPVPCSVLIRSVRCGIRHTLALGFDGSVWACGSNEHGQCAQPAGIRNCTELTPVLVDPGATSLPVREIGAWAKSDFSVALAESGTFYVWGTTFVSGQAVDNYRPVRIETTIPEHPLGRWDVILSHLEVAHLPDDRRRYGDWPFETQLICTDGQYSTASPTPALEALNQPSECDVVFCFHQTIEEQSTVVSMIFVQREPLESSDMLNRLPADWMQNQDEEENHGEDQPHQSSSQMLMIGTRKMTVNKLNRIYRAVDFHEWSILPSVLYAYLVFLCSGRRYMIIMAGQLFEMVGLADKLQDQTVMDQCFRYLSQQGSIQQLCQFYTRALGCNLDGVQRFCLGVIRVPQNQPQIVQLFKTRETTFDLEFKWMSEDDHGKPIVTRTIRSHKLVVMAMGRFYNPGSSVMSAAIRLNPVIDYRELSLLSYLIMPSNVDPELFELYLYRLYHGRFPSVYLNDLDFICQMIRLMVQLDDQPIQQELECVLPTMVNKRNVCQFYLKHCFESNDDNKETKIFRNICMDFVVKNLPELLFLPEFDHLSYDPPVLQGFFQHLRQHGPL